MNEDWKTIPGYSRYEISNLGNVRKKLKTCLNGEGYETIGLISDDGNKKDLRVHRLVANLFIEKKDSSKNLVNHIDGIKNNNIVSNLEWCTAKENMLHARVTGLHKSDGQKPVLQIKNGIEINRYNSGVAASEATGINRSSINNVCRKYVYKGKHYRTAGGFEWRFAE